jgi:TolA-binding protein
MKTNLKIIIIYFQLIIIIAGCSVWENFTTYFNRWYNIKQLYQEIEKDIESQKKNIFSNEPLNLSGTSRTNLTKIVDKCSDLLQFNYNSSMVDDALLVLGKAFYYQGNYQKSKRKFEELLSTNPSEKYILESKLFIAKCDLQLKNFIDGLKLIRDVIAQAIAEDYGDILADALIEEIKYFKSIEDYSAAIDLLNKFLKYIDDDELLSLAYLELGNLYSIKNDYSNAVNSFFNAIELTSDFDVEIKATLNYATSLRLNNEAKKSLEFLEDIKRKDKFSESLPQIELEIGKSYATLGKYEDAFDVFYTIDTTYKNSPFAPLALYEIGKIYEQVFNNYDSAASYYNRSFISNPPREHQKEISEKNNLFTSYIRLRKTIDNLDKQLFYALNPEIFKQDSIAYVQDSLKILKEYLEGKELSEIWKNVYDSDKQKVTINYFSFRDSAFVKDSIKLADSLNKSFVRLEPDSVIKILLAKSFIRDSVKFVDSLKFQGLNLENDEINILLSERRKKLLSLDENKNQLTDYKGYIPVDSLNFKKNPPTLPKIPINELKEQIAKNRLELGNLFFIEFELPDSSYKLYTEIIKDFDSTKYFPDALIALGSYYLTVNEKQKADSIFQKIYEEYKHLSIANVAADKLGLPLIDFTYDPGKEIFLMAENYIKQKDFKNGIENFIRIYKEFPTSKFSDKGLFAAGFILENDLRLSDSAVTVYDTLIANYPNSEFVRNIAMKVTIYKQEKARIQRELEEEKNKSLTKENEELNLLFQGTTEDEELKKQIEEEVLTEKEIDKEKQLINFTPKKKLERLWNPRKHKR